MFKNNFKKKIMALAILGAIMATGSMAPTTSQAATKTYFFNMKNGVNVNKSLNYIHDETAPYYSAGRSNAKVVVDGRSPKYLDDGFGDCPIYFVHKNQSKGKYATVGVWLRSFYGTINCTYIKNSQVTNGTKMRTYAKTDKDSTGTNYNTAIYGKIWY